MKPTPLQRYRIYEHNAAAAIDRAINAYTAFVWRNRRVVIGAAIGALIVAGYSAVSTADFEEQVRIEQEHTRAAEERAVAIAQWHRERHVRVVLEGEPAVVARLARQFSDLPQ